MRKLFFATAVVMLFSGITKSAVNPPQDYRGISLNTIDFVGAVPCLISEGTYATTGAPIVCTQGSSQTVTRGVVYGVMSAGLAPTAYMVFRDTVPGGAGGVSGVNASTVCVVYNSSSTLYYGGGTNFIKFPVPIQFKYGIAVNVSGQPSGGTQSWTILYRPLQAGE